MAEGWRTYSMCINVAGFLRNSRFPRDYRGVFQHDDGREMTPAVARKSLQYELAMGRKVIPCSKECGNPCPRADRGCTGFDYAGRGCPGCRTEKSDG